MGKSSKKDLMGLSQGPVGGGGSVHKQMKAARDGEGEQVTF